MSDKNNRISVLFCTDGIFPHAVGGMQRHSRLLIEALARSGEVDLTVLHPHPEEQIFADFPEVKEIALDPLPQKKHYFLELKDYSKQVLAQALAHPDHLIYSQGLSIWAGVDQVADRMVINPHGLEPFQAIGATTKAKTWPYRYIFRRLFRRAAHTVSLGGHLTGILQRAMGRQKDKLVVLPNATNPVDLPREQLRKAQQKPLRFLFVGRFAYNKGIDVLLEAVSRLNAAGLQEAFSLDLTGKGPLFEEMTARYALPNVRFLGFVSDEELFAAYLDNHVFVFPTLFEGMPTVVLEGMARGMPVIVTDVGATRELVSPENGRIIETQDIEDLMAAMKEMMERPASEFDEMSKVSLEKFEARFTWEAVARQHIRLFQKMCGSSS